jgi:hypothetical protein
MTDETPALTALANGQALYHMSVYSTIYRTKMGQDGVSY